MRRYMAVAAAVVLAGCVSTQDISRALRAVDQEWRDDYFEILKTDGTRYYIEDREFVLEVLTDSLRSMGMTVETDSRNIREVRAFSQAPHPLTAAEWAQIAAIEEARMKRIITEEIGPLSAQLFRLAPESYQVVLGAKLRQEGSVTQVRLSAQLRYIGGLEGIYTNQYVPPLAAEMGAEKIWASLDDVLRRRGLVMRETSRPPGFQS